jgi:hypothetical protein
MAFKFNPATGKFEVVPSQDKGNSPVTGLPGVTNKKTTPTPKGMPGVTVKPKKDESPYGEGQGTYGGVSLPNPNPTVLPPNYPPAAPAVAGPPAPSTAGQQPDGQSIINSMWQSLYDEAVVYRGIYGEEPPASWWSARTTPIEAAQKRLDASAKSTGDGGKAAKEEAERIRSIKGGREGEAFLREQAVTRKAEMLKRVAELYDPQETKSAEDLKTVLQSASDAFDLAEKQVGTAQEQFTKNFKGSTAYEGAPVSTFNVADNPLLAALQSQGAGTGEVQAATDLARQSAQSSSDLQKWAMSQLNTGQQNYGSAVQNAAQMGTMAALQQLGGRRADVKTGIEQQFADALAKIGAERTGSESKVDESIADIISKADEIRAKTTADFGTLPKEKIDKTLPIVKKPVAGTKAKTKVKP